MTYEVFVMKPPSVSASAKITMWKVSSYVLDCVICES